jgi:hypothetical protein
VGAGADRRVLQRSPAGPLEELILDRLRRIGIPGRDGDSLNWTAIRPSLVKVEVGAETVTLHLKPNAITRAGDATGFAARLAPGDQVTTDEAGIWITIPARFTRRSGTLVAINPTGGNAIARIRHDRALVTALVRAEAWKRRLLSGTVTRLEELAREEGVTASYVTRVMRVAFLAPDLKRAILDGVQPAGLTLQRVQDQEMPLAWERQRAQYCC